ADCSFAIKIGKEFYVRSIAKIDLNNGIVHFYCDIAPGEELILVKRTNLATHTQADYQKFLQGKPGKPVAGILNDCILRRLYNGND
ncbi:FIST C-terminal domain-containing protein, partial [Staphylococcus aureus]